MTLTKKEALNRAMNICSRSEKCIFDINESLTRWGVFSEIDRSEIVEYLKNNNFIDETRYTKSYVRDKHNFNRWGKIKIRAMLKSKQIDEQSIAIALDSINADDYLITLIDELRKKRKSVKASNHFDLKGKLMRFAHARGYETDLIYKAIDKILLDDEID